MKVENVIDSVKTDSKDALLYIGTIILIISSVIFFMTYGSEILATIHSFSTAVTIAIIGTIIIDATCIKLSTFPEDDHIPSTKPAPLWWTLGAYTFMYGVMIVLYYVPPERVPYPDLTVGFALNTIFVIIMCIAARVWARNYYEKNDGGIKA